MTLLYVHDIVISALSIYSNETSEMKVKYVFFKDTNYAR